MSENHVGEPQIFVGLSVSEWGLVRAGLYELPAKLSVAVIGKVETQLATALEKKPVKTEEGAA